MKKICEAFQLLPCKSMKITGICMSTNKHMRSYVVNISDPKVCADANEFLSNWRMGPITDFQISNSVHYANYVDDKMVTFCSTTTGMLGSPLKTMTCVEWIASTDGCHHTPFVWIEHLKSAVSKKRQKSFLFTQCAKLTKAKQFWRGRLTCSKWADVCVGLFHLYDDTFRIYDDVLHMST